MTAHHGVTDRSRVAVEAAAETIRHRGPDSEGLLAAPFAHVAFRRLAVIDPAGGSQPATSEDGAVQVFLNGEIFNHRELRRRLVQRGHVLGSRSDTEVLPHLWEDDGPDMLAQLNGMFAICVVDLHRGEVFLARDRLGIKPLFVARTSTGTVFASELKAVLATGLVAREFAPEAAVRYVNSLSAGGRQTLVRGVERLLPGESLLLSGGRHSSKQWYDLAEATDPRRGSSDPAEFIELLRGSVELQLEADVPVGISLSGGLDSTGLAYFARRGGHEDVTAFTVDVEGAPEEELASARSVSKALGLEHQVLSSATMDFVSDAPAVVWAADEPTADPAFYPALKIAEAASSVVTVLLAGSGADEILGGYGHHRLSRKRRLLSRAPAIARRPSEALLPRLSGLDVDEVQALSRYEEDRFEWHLRAMSHLTASERARFTTWQKPEADPAALLRTAFARARPMSPQQQQLFADTVTYLPDQLLPVLDRSTMAYSLEGRVPFLDHHVVEAGLRLPDADRVGTDGATKAVLRRELRGKVPDVVLERRKLGFPNAVERWIRGDLGELLPAILDHPEGMLRQHFPSEWLEALFCDRKAAIARWPVVYALVTLEIWHRLFIVEAATTRPEVTLNELYNVAAGTRRR